MKLDPKAYAELVGYGTARAVRDVESKTGRPVAELTPKELLAALRDLRRELPAA